MIRPETSADHAAIREVNISAFDGPEEADLIDLLRDDGDVIASLVAEDAGAVVGHIMFSPLIVEGPPLLEGTARRILAAALAPVSVRPEWQREGIGSALVRRGLDRCRERGVEAVIVLGHADYYPRFGFSAALAERLDAPFSGESFMALELLPGVLAGTPGCVHYAKAFGLSS